MALAHGADLVLELPLPYAVSAAAYFARGAVRLLVSTGVVDCLSFGSECGNIETIRQAILTDEPVLFKETLRKQLDEGASYATARGRAMEAALPAAPPGLFTEPNNGLGMEYCRVITEYEKGIHTPYPKPLHPFTLPRSPVSETLRSAGEIRKALGEGRHSEAEDAMPPAAFALLTDGHKKNAVAGLDAYSEIFKYLIIRNALCGPDMTEGLENRFRRMGQAGTLIQILDAVKTKRYTYTRLQRAALHTVLGLQAEDMRAYEAAGGPQYIRVLGFRKESEPLLKEMHRLAALPVVMQPRRAAKTGLSPLGLKMLENEIEAAGLYALACGTNAGQAPWRSEYSEPLVVIS
jgi:predicted nucleotidyltransferase